MSSRPIPIPQRTRFLSWEEESALHEQSMVFACKQHIDQYGWSEDFARLYGHIPELRDYDPQDPPKFCHGVTAAEQRFLKSHDRPSSTRILHKDVINAANCVIISKQYTITKKNRPRANERTPHFKSAAPECQNGKELAQKEKEGICRKETNGTNLTRKQEVVTTHLKRNGAANYAKEQTRHDRVEGSSKKFEVHLLPCGDQAECKKDDKEKLPDHQVGDFAIDFDYWSDGETEPNLEKRLPHPPRRHHHHTREPYIASASDLRLEVPQVKYHKPDGNTRTRKLPKKRTNSPINTKPQRCPTTTAGTGIPQAVFRPALDPNLHIKQQLKQQDLATRTSKLKLRELVRHAREASTIQDYLDDRDHHDSETIEAEVDLWNLKI